MDAGIARPIVIQTHVEPIPEFIVKNAIRIIGVSKEEFCIFQWLIASDGMAAYTICGIDRMVGT